MKGTGIRINHNAFVVDEILTSVGVGEVIKKEKKNKKKKKDKESKKNKSSVDEKSDKKGKKNKDKGKKKDGKSKSTISIDIPSVPTPKEVERKALAFIKREKEQKDSVAEATSQEAPKKESKEKKKKKKDSEKGKKDKKAKSKKKDKKKSRRSVEERVEELQGAGERAAIGDITLDIDNDNIKLTDIDKLSDISEEDLSHFTLPIIDDKD